MVAYLQKPEGTTARTTDDGEVEITASIDGQVKTITEASLRRHLKLEDSDGITSLPNTEIFEQLALMGYFPTLTQVADEATFISVDVDAGGAATTNIGLDAGQGSCTIHKTPTRPYDSPLLRVYTLGSDKGNLQQNELIDLVTKLTDRVKVLENDMQQTKKVYSSALTKLILRVKKLEKKVKTNKARRRARIGRSDDAEMFDINDLHGDEVAVDMPVGEKQEQSAKVDEREIDEITTTSAPTTTINEITLAQTLIEIKAAKPKAVTTAATTTTTTRPKARGVVVYRDNSTKRAGDKLESDKSKKQKTDENEEVEVDNEVELKKHMVTVKDDDIAIDSIPLATKPPVIVEYKLIREGIMGIDREDLHTLWELVKTKHGDTRPEDEHERVLWGDLNVMFEPDIKSDVWRNPQGYKVTVWKLFDSCGVHFVRFGNVHIFMLVEKRYPITPITITNMLNKKLQADY
ncbi:hypothetical protein Tco_0308743 [Tanacetum coccineum]